MADKEIIIDGVDVSGCEHINTCDNKIKCVILQDDVCETNPYCEGYNCYYKQLAREKQNSQEARDTTIKEFNRAEELNTLLKRKEQECERLKDELSTYGATGICETCTAKSVLQNDKYTKALREIKEIAEEQIPYLNIDKAKTITEVEYDYADKIYNLEQRMYKILQKISEVNNGR